VIGDPVQARPRPASFDRRLLAPMVLGSVLNPVNSSIIAVSLIPIGRALGEPPSRTAWLVSALYLATAVGQPVAGRLVDLFGPRRVYLAGTALVGVAGVLGVLAPDLGVLVAARVLLGIGTCAGYPAAMYLVRSEARRTGQDSPAGVLTTLAVAAQTISVVGPTLGGLLIEVGGWRTTFGVNVPLAAACLLMGARRLPRRTDAARVADDGRRPGVDPAGIATFAVALLALLLFLTTPGSGRWWLPVLSAAALLAFVVRERRARDPFIDLRVLGDSPALVATYVRALLAWTVSYAFLYGYTQWLEEARGLSPARAGLVLLPMFAVAIAVSVTTGRRAAVRGKLVVGAVAQVAACTLLLLLGDRTSVWALLGLAVLLGVPQGLLSLANQNAVYHQAVPARTASSAGLLRTFGYLGAITASAANGAFLGRSADTAGLHRLAAFVLGASALLLVVTLADRSLGRLGRDGVAARA
jgi:MFS family permease